MVPPDVKGTDAAGTGAAATWEDFLEKLEGWPPLIVDPNRIGRGGVIAVVLAGKKIQLEKRWMNWNMVWAP